MAQRFVMPAFFRVSECIGGGREGGEIVRRIGEERQRKWKWWW